MRLALLFEYPTLYGGERSMLTALDAVDRDAVHLSALAPPEGRLADALRSRDIEHVPLQLFNDSGQRRPREVILPELTAAVDAVNPDVIHANSLSMSMLTGLLENLVPRIGHIRDILSLSKNAIRVLNQNDLLIAVSHATRDYHVAQGLDPVKLRVVYNGLSPQLFSGDTTAPLNIRKELSLPEDTLLAMTVGQIGLRKGLDVLVRAIDLVAPKLPHLDFLIVGERSSAKAESVEYEANLHAGLEESGLSHRVHWLGYREDVPQLMAEADLLVHAAHQEPLGRVLLEAAAVGLPIVATDVGGTGEIVQNQESARLVPPGDENELAIGIWELATDHELRETFRTNARRRAETQFTAETAADRLMDAWQLFLF